MSHQRSTWRWGRKAPPAPGRASWPHSDEAPSPPRLVSLHISPASDTRPQERPTCRQAAAAPRSSFLPTQGSKDADPGSPVTGGMTETGDSRHDRQALAQSWRAPDLLSGWTLGLRPLLCPGRSTSPPRLLPDRPTRTDGEMPARARPLGCVFNAPLLLVLPNGLLPSGGRWHSLAYSRDTQSCRRGDPRRDSTPRLSYPKCEADPIKPRMSADTLVKLLLANQ